MTLLKCFKNNSALEPDDMMPGNVPPSMIPFINACNIASISWLLEEVLHIYSSLSGLSE